MKESITNNYAGAKEREQGAERTRLSVDAVWAWGSAGGGAALRPPCLHGSPTARVWIASSAVLDGLFCFEVFFKFIMHICS